MSNIFVQNPTRNFFMTNGTYDEKKRIMNLTEADLSQVSTNLVSKLYSSAIEKTHVDFGNIPTTKGDFTKYSGYTDMVECLQVVDAIAVKSNIKIKETEIVSKAIGNIVMLRDIFTKGYALNKNFLMLQYTTLAASCVAATSSIIASFVDYVKTPDKVEFTIIQSKTNQGVIHIDALDQFNKSVASGEYTKVCNTILKDSRALGLQESAVVITAAVITSVVALVALMRQIVFRFYYNRMKLSDYLEMQATFLRMNKATIEASESRLSPSERKKVIKKQADLADKLTKWSDKLRVEDVSADSKASREITQQNKTFSLDSMEQNPGLDGRIELL